MTDRQKVTLRLNPEVIDLVRELAEEMGISPAGLVDRLLLEGLERYIRDELTFEGYLEPAAQGRYAWTVKASPNGLRAAIAQKMDIT